MTAFLALIQTILSGIPIIGNFLNSGFGQIIAKFFDSKTAIETARLGGAAQVAVAAQQARVAGLGVIAGSTLLTVLVLTFASPLVIFEWKVVVWDTVLGWGTTPPVHGQVAAWGNTIIGFLFGSVTALGIASVFRKGG